MATKRYGKIERYWLRVKDPATSRVCILDFRSFAKALHAETQLINVLGTRAKELEFRILDTKHTNAESYENNN